MTDLEADVDDVDEEGWDDEGIEKDLDINDVHMAESNGTHLEHSTFMNSGMKSGDGELPAPPSSRILSVQNGQGPSHSISNVASNFANGPDQALGSVGVMYRRNISRTNTGSSMGDAAASRPDAVSRGGQSFSRFSRPVTPIQSLSRDDQMTPDGSPSGRGEILGRDGPITPTNHAGPFVFDGSGGRRVGPSPASDAANNE
jgi:hypothetical protein